VLSLAVFSIAYYGIEYSQPVAAFIRMKVALAITAIVVGGGIGSFYVILYRNKILNEIVYSGDDNIEDEDDADESDDSDGNESNGDESNDNQY
jgi:hypothetical protein